MRISGGFILDLISIYLPAKVLACKSFKLPVDNMPAEGRIAEEYAGKEASKGNFIPLLALIGLSIVIMLAKRHYLKKIAIGQRSNTF